MPTIRPIDIIRTISQVLLIQAACTPFATVYASARSFCDTASNLDQKASLAARCELAVTHRLTPKNYDKFEQKCPDTMRKTFSQKKRFSGYDNCFKPYTPTCSRWVTFLERAEKWMPMPMPMPILNQITIRSAQSLRLKLTLWRAILDLNRYYHYRHIK